MKYLIVIFHGYNEANLYKFSKITVICQTDFFGSQEVKLQSGPKSKLLYCGL